jgi:hypothetical protein
MTLFSMRHTRLFIPAALVAALVAAGTLFASTEDSPKIPTDFQRGYPANSMLAAKEPNNTGIITGAHLIDVNSVGLEIPESAHLVAGKIGLK